MNIGFIGGGNMGEAIIASLYKTHKIIVSELSYTRRAYLKRKYRCVCGSVQDVVQKSQVIVLAVKPQNMDKVLVEISSITLRSKLLVSIAAGIPTKYIAKKLQQKVRVVRTMPNLPAKIAEGVTAICAGQFATKADVNKVRRIFDHVGSTVVVEEKQIDAVTAISGSGPAYVFYFVEALINEAKKMGFTDQQAHNLVMGTLLGSAHLLDASKDSAAVLRQQVTSKGGTTEAALKVLTQKGFARIIRDALRAAKARAKQLSK